MEASGTSQARPVVYLVAIDDSEASRRVLEVAAGLGAALGGNAELHVARVAVVPPPVSVGSVLSEDVLDSVREFVTHACEGAKERFQGRIVGHVLIGEPWEAITRASADLQADLIVVGTAGRTGFSRLTLGSVAEMVVRRAGCPVLVVRPKDFGDQGTVQIEPPCPACVEVQKTSAGKELWCERHASAKGRPTARLHYELPPSYGRGSMLIRP